MAVTAWLANYPFSDPLFQFFQVQQYLTQPGVNPAQTYTVAAPGVVNHEEIASRMRVELEAAPADAEPEDKPVPTEKPARAPRKPAKDAS